MSTDHFIALSPTARQGADTALSEVLGLARIDSVTPVTGGATSARLFRIDARGRHYLLRIEGTPSPLRNPHQYIALRMAEQAGIAPKLYFVDETSRIAVMDFIERRPLSTYPGGTGALATAVGDLLRRLQATALFPAFVQYPDIVSRLWAHVCRTGLFAPGVLDRYSEHLDRICKIYVWPSADLVSSHNDPVPSNILFDGERLWMIDWESAYRNDPLVDVAIVLDNLARSPELETELVKAWLGRAPDKALWTRLALVRSLTRLYYAGVLLSASTTAPRAAPDTTAAAPSLADFQEALRSRRLKAGTPATNHVLGKMFLASFLTGAQTPSLGAAV